MPNRQHVCRGCDHIAKVAAEYGFLSWRTVWDAQSAGFRSRRPDPCILFKGGGLRFGGDVLTIPARDAGEASRGVDAEHPFRVPDTGLRLYLRILNEAYEPVANAEYELTVPGANAGLPFTGRTDSSGHIDIAGPLPPGTVSANLVVRVPAEATDDCAGRDPAPAPPEGGEGAAAGARRGDVPVEWNLMVGALNPIMARDASDSRCVSGVQQRLNNLCLNTGPVDGILGPNTRAAITAFQDLYGLGNGNSGQSDRRTQEMLQRVHEGPDPVPTPTGG